MKRSHWLVITLLVYVSCGGGNKAQHDGGLIDAGAGECSQQKDCEPAEICSSNQCIPATCEDGFISGNESDIDCGGSCLPCGLGFLCSGAGDCQSQYCDANRCTACGDTEQCDSDRYCADGACELRFDNGADCGAPEQCASGVCEDEGVCCDVVCDGDCSIGTCVPRVGLGEECAADDDCVSDICDTQDGVCCNEACSADCSGGTCIRYANGIQCSLDDSCQSGQCERACNPTDATTNCLSGVDDVCCDQNCELLGSGEGVCAGGSCMYGATKYNDTDCLPHSPSPITYSAAATLYQCVYGLANDSSALGIAAGDTDNTKSCQDIENELGGASAWVPMVDNDDWSYVSNRWVGNLSAINAPTSRFTTCFKHVGEATKQALRMYTHIQ